MTPTDVRGKRTIDGDDRISRIRPALLWELEQGSGH
jgi:hypothetical protein